MNKHIGSGFDDYLRSEGMIIINLPIKTVSEANTREHWAPKANRARQQRSLAKLNVAYHGADLSLPARITLTRLGPRKLDSDNLAISFKHVRDGIADAFKVDDGDERYCWVYRQEHSKDYGVRIEIEMEASHMPVGEF